MHAHAPELTGWLDAEISDAEISDAGPGDGETSDGTLHLDSAYLELAAAAITGANPLLTREIGRRLQPGRFPLVRADIIRAEQQSRRHYRVDGELTLHGVRRSVSGSARVDLRDAGALLVTGDVTLDVTDFGMRVPRMLGLRVDPEVEVHLVIHATPAS